MGTKQNKGNVAETTNYKYTGCSNRELDNEMILRLKRCDR